MSAAKSRNDELLLVNAYLDGELDAPAALAFERRLVKDKGLKAAHDRLSALRVAMRGQALADPVSAAFQSKLERIMEPPATTSAKTSSYSWRQMAASIVVAATLASGVTMLGLRDTQMPSAVDAVLAGHERSLIASTPVDVASSDHHTVKPWFDQHLALSPPVPDLASAGFVLDGGRVEIVDGKPVPVLVYKSRQHLISVVAQPSPGHRPGNSDPDSWSRDGYHVLSWAGQDFRYYAVSDITSAELEGFVKSWRDSQAAP